MSVADVADDIPTLLASANKLLMRGRYERAWPACEVLLANDWWRCHAVAGRVQLEWGKADADHEKLKRAVNLLDAALTRLRDEKDPSAVDLAELCNDKGVALYELDELGAAQAAYEEALIALPDHERALCNMGLIHWAKNHLRIALSYFDRAVASANSSNPHSLNNRGALRLEMLGEDDGPLAALPDFHAAVALDPFYAIAIRNRNGALESLKEPVPMAPVPECKTYRER